MLELTVVNLELSDIIKVRIEKTSANIWVRYNWQILLIVVMHVH